jgi:CheY-like chemotaxis protein
VRPAEVRDEHAGGGEKVLVVDDDPDVRLIVVGMVTRLGHPVLQAADGAEALSILSDETAAVDLVITDFNMPKVGGVELYRRGRELRPDLGFVLCSGNLDDWAPARHDQDPRAACLEKPFNSESLARAVAEALGSTAD